MRQIAKTRFDKEYWLIWYTNFSVLYTPASNKTDNDIQVVLEDSNGRRLGDAICHFGSYGVDLGLWEIMMEDGGDITGYLTFKEVMRKFSAKVKSYERNQI